MDTTLKKLKNVSSENCITILMNTHRTKPDCLKDELTLKNLIKDVENRLFENLTKREATPLMAKLKTLVSQIDHSYNLDSLILFVNEDIAEFARLPIPVTNRVVIDSTFSTRALIRAIHAEFNYYILVLSQDKVRFIEALNDKVVKEFKSPFPMENTQFFAKNNIENAVASRRRNLMAEFFNQVDKEVNAIRKQNPLPLLISTVEENYPEYLKIADDKHSIFKTFLNDNRIAEKEQTIVAEAWKIIEAYNKEKNTARKSELLKAVAHNKFLSDTNDIWRAIHEGKVKTLFVEKGLFQPAIVEDNVVIYVSNNRVRDKEVIDDIFDEMIELNMRFGGDVVFLPKGELTKFNGFGAITRY